MKFKIIGISFYFVLMILEFRQHDFGDFVLIIFKIVSMILEFRPDHF